MNTFRTLVMVIVAFAMLFQTAVAVNIMDLSVIQEKKCVRISYSLDEDARVEPQYSLDGGKTYQMMTNVVGEIGERVFAGQREFVWNAMEELGKGGHYNIVFRLVPSPLGCGTVTDVDKRQYSTVVIGKQCWIRENMRSERGSTGDKITLLPEYSKKNSAFAFATASDNDAYGYLYNYEAAAQVCPKGWRLPTKEEVKELIAYLRSIPCYSCGKEKGAVAKSIAGYADWKPEQEQCLVGQDLVTNNASGFSALPAGKNGTDVFMGAYFWTSTGKNIRYDDHSERVNMVYGIISSSTMIEMEESSIENACSVRCIRDTSWRDDKPTQSKERIAVSIRPDARKLFLVNATCQASALQVRKIGNDDFSFGFMAGRYKFLGGYFSAMWNGKGKGLFRKQPAGEQWLGVSKRSSVALTAGIVVSPCKNVNFYAGTGPNFSIELKQSEGGKWFMDSKSLRVGAEVEAGVLFNFGGFAMNFGVSTTNFKSLALKAGIGWSSRVKK